jgi:hypothetical protein
LERRGDTPSIMIWIAPPLMAGLGSFSVQISAIFILNLLV